MMAETRSRHRLHLVQPNVKKRVDRAPTKKTGIVKPKAVVNEKKVKRTIQVSGGTEKPKRKCGRVAATVLPKRVKNVYVPTSRPTLVIPQEEDPEFMEVDSDPPESVLKDTLPEGVVDIDEEDAGDPQLASDNVKDIYTYLRELEVRYEVQEDFMRKSKISSRMRSILINWLSQVHLQFKLLPETLYLTVDIIDRFLSYKGSRLLHKHLQLAGVTAMFIASKYEEMYVPTVEDFVFMCDNAFGSGDVLCMELKILSALEFQMGKPSAITFLRRNSKAGMVETKHHILAKYILEECMMNSNVAHFKPSIKAAAALLMSLKISSPKMKLKAIWDANLVYYSGYSLEEELLSAAGDIASWLMNVQGSKYQAAFDKYNCASRGYASLMPGCHPKILEGFSEGTLT